MATQSNIPVTSGSGNNVDTTTTATAGNKRQVVVIGDPSTDAGYAPVDPTNGVSVAVKTLPALPAGANAIGSVSVSNFPGTQPVSGTVTANVGTTNGLALDATLTGGTQRSKVTDGTNNAAVKAASTAAVATDPALVVAVSPNNTVGVTGTFWQATQPVSGTVTANVGTTNGLALDATLTGGTQKTKIVDSAGTNVATVSAAGAVKVDGSAVTQPVSGTITANVGTTNGLALDSSVNGSIVAQASTTSGQKGHLIQGAVTTAAPTYTTGQTDPLSLNTSGGLRVDGSGVTQPVSGTVTANAGTGNFNIIGTQSDNSTDSTAKLPTIPARANAAAPTWTEGNQVPLSTDLSGNLRVTGSLGSNASVGSNLATAPTSDTLVGSVYNTSPPAPSAGQMVALQADSSGNLKVNIAAGAAAGGTSAVDEAAWTAGSSAFTSAGGVYNDSAAALTAGQMGTARVTNNRALHANLRNASGTEIGTVANPVNVTDAQLPAALGQTTMSASLPVVLASDQVSTVTGDTGQNGLVVTSARKEVSFSTTTAQAVATTDVSNYRWVSIHITSQGTSSTITWQASNDNVNWTNIGLQYLAALGGTGMANSVTLTNVIYHGPTSARYFRLNVTGITAGTTAGVIEFFAVPPTALTNYISVGQQGTWTMQPGNTANTTPWLQKISDGTNAAAIKAASTAAAAADPSLVVALSPNSPIPTGSNSIGNIGTVSTVSAVTAISNALPAGTNSIGTVQPGNTANTTPWLFTQTPGTSGGLSTYRLLSAASTNSNNIKSSAGQVFGFIITNTNAAARFVKLYNKATAPTVGTDTPVITLVIPGNSTGSGMVASEFTNGIAFGTGIGIGITGAVTDADTTVVAANEVVVNLFYK